MTEMKSSLSRFDEDFDNYPNELKPQLHLPYYSRKLNLSTSHEKLLNNNLNWLRKFNFKQEILDTLIKRKFIDIILRYIKSDDQPERITLITDFTSLNSLIEIYLSKHECNGNLIKVKKFLSKMKSILNDQSSNDINNRDDNDDDDDEANSIFAAVANIWQRLRMFSTKQWQHRFKENFLIYLNAREIKSDSIINHYIPTLAEYMAIKPYTSMSLITINLLEILGDCELNENLAENETIQQLAYLVALHIGFSFDILLIPAQLKISNYWFNLVTVCKKDYNLNWQPAYSGANRIHNHQIKHFEANIKYMLPFSGDDLILLKRFLNRLQLFLGAYAGYLKEDLQLLD